MVAALAPLAIYLLLSGLDDLFVDFAWLLIGLAKGALAQPPPADLPGAPRRAIAIFVPLWREHEVIGSMVAHNMAAIRYDNYHFFVGAYPNDEPTLDAVRELETRFENVHLAVCANDGPTSKADCLNWIFQNMLRYEEHAGFRFELILTHDAEDIIHPESLRWMDYFARRYDFIQIPVLALKTPMLNLTHGIYCDEFAEFQTRDLVVRSRLGGFVPSAGVGTGYSRRALQALAETEANRIFEPTSLTEDYDNGWRLHALGFKQIYVPPMRANGSWVATREYFPRQWQSAIRQRTRWVTGIALQGWERHGWSGGARQVYWLWRDRKGLIGSPLSLLTNFLTLYALTTRMWDRVHPAAWEAALFGATLGLQLLRTGVRIGCVQRIYGWKFAALVPLRSVVANWINCWSVVGALRRFARARLRGEPLVWLKTVHSYPSMAALAEHRRKIGEILIGSGYIEAEVFERALAEKPADVRIGEYLVAGGLLSESDLYEALSLQQGVPLGAPAQLNRKLARTLPAHVVREFRVVPFQVAAGKLFLAAADVPSDAAQAEIRQYTSLDLRFHLVTPSAYGELERQISAGS